MTEYEKNLNRVKKIAEEKGWVLNPDEERIKKVVGLMTDNFIAVGEYVCPCKQQYKPPVKGKDILCPCPDFEKEVKTDGHCFCKLFYTPEKAKEVG